MQDLLNTNVLAAMSYHGIPVSTKAPA